MNRRINSFIARAAFLAAMHGVVFSWAGMPLLKGIEEPRPLGPVTEKVDVDPYQRVLHVAPPAEGEGAADGSKGKPFHTVRAAIEAASDASAKNRYAVLVAAGTYNEFDLRMKPFVELFGGFDGSWSRDVARNRSILDAQRKGPVIYGADDARLDGFVLINGEHKAPGGAILCEHASPTISNNVVRDNRTAEPAGFRRDMIHQRGTDGGAIALIVGSAAVVRNNLIYDNATAIGNGGGIYVWNESKPQIRDNVICANRTGVAGRDAKEGSRSSNGGGIAVSRDCAPLIDGNLILMNVTADNSDGGGIYLEYDAHAKIRGNWIVANRGQDDGGGMYSMKASEPVVEYNLFVGNRNTSGGSSAIRISKEGRMRAANNLFIDNPNNAIDCVNSWMVLRNNTFVEGSDYAVIFENQAQHLAPSEISGNVFLGTPTPVRPKTGAGNPLMAENYVSAQGAASDGSAGAGGLAFIDDGRRGTVGAGNYDAASCTTTYEVSGVDLRDEQLDGRVIQISDQWSVIKSTSRSTLTIWGKATAGAFSIAPTYRPAKRPGAPDRGAYAARPSKE